MTLGNFLVRMTPEAHRDLKRAAARAGASLNELCAIRLALPSALEQLPKDVQIALPTLAKMASDQLLGIVIFGSWARGDANSLSDIDILVVVKDGKVINREIYRRWERLATDETRVEPAFVALPDVADKVSGLWAEVALDGIIIADQSTAIHGYVSHVRHLIADGRLVQRRAHGQNYWVHQEVA